MAEQMKPAYLLAGGDQSKLSAALARLRARAEREGGAGALEDFSGSPPDVEALVGAMPAISLTASRRYLLADGVERWRAAQVKAIAAALAADITDVTVVLVARGAAPKGLAEAVEAGGGDVLTYAAPSRRDLPGWLIAGARERGIEMAPQAARMLIARLGDGTARLATELDRLALWAGAGGTVDAEDVEELVADATERRGWTLADAILARDVEATVRSAEELLEQGEAVTPLIYGMASRLRSALQAATMLAAGTPAGKVEAALPMAPYPSKLVVRAVRGLDPAELVEAIGVVADLEWWTRGGSDYDERVAMTLAVRRAAGA